jgi:hypothetical protein
VSEALAVRAEIAKLARLLRREPSEFAYLETVPVDDLRRLREQVTEMLFAAHGHALARLARGSRLLPIAVIAIIAERAFGPLLAARMAAMLDPARAVVVAARLPTAFLADVAVDIDPRRTAEVISNIPAARIAEVTRELVRREEVVTIGRFVGHLPDEAIMAALEVTHQRALLEVALVLEDREGLDRLVNLLPQPMLTGLISAAIQANRRAEMMELLAGLSEPMRKQVQGLVEERGTP